jgi:Transposase and inactivated derivatives
MPRKNTTRDDSADAFYHIYNCGNNNRKIFLDDSDYRYFEMLLARSVSSKKTFDRFSRQYANFNEEVEIHAYCLMPSSFHLLLHQKDKGQINRLMRSVGTAYSMYFNKKYQRSGQLYESRFKAVPVRDDEQLKNVSRFIHLKPMNYLAWDYSSYSDYIYSARDWITAKLILNMFDSSKLYADFVADYEDAERVDSEYLL